MCCGAKRNIPAARGVQRPAAPVTAKPLEQTVFVQFEYTGPTKLTVISPITGARYHFDSPGARLTVDPRDQSMMTYVPGLRPLGFKHS